jgi:hypothetical protein
VKYIILTYASQQDYDGIAGKASDKSAWSAADFVALGAFMEKFNQDLVECESFDRATEIAARLGKAPAPEHVAARAFADVRPIAESRADLEG